MDDQRKRNDGIGLRRSLFLPVFIVLLACLALWSRPGPTLSAEPAAQTPQAAPASAVIYTVDRCPPNYQKRTFAPGEIIYLHGTGFRPWEPVYWEIWGTANSCDADRLIAHSRMTAGWNGTFCIYCYTVAFDDCGTYKVVVNGVYLTFYDVPAAPGPSATTTSTPTGTPTSTPTLLPTPYTFTGYVFEEGEGAGQAQPAAGIPIPDVTVKLYYKEGEEWELVADTRTTHSGWFALEHVAASRRPFYRIVEVDPEGYASSRAEPPPLHGYVIDPNTIEMRMPYGAQAGAMYFYDYRADPTATPTETPTWTGTPPTPTYTPTPIPTTKIRTRTLQQGLDGYRGVEDTYITSWYLYRNYHTLNKMAVRSGDQMAPMLRFDLAFIEPGSRVLEAKLYLYAFDAGPHPMRAEAFRVYRPWKVSEVNWIEASAGYRWGEWGCNRPGLDRAVQPDDGQNLTAVGRWYEFDLTNMAQAWVDSATQNQGVILKGSGDISVQWYFHASEYWIAEFRPKLVITYALPPATPTPTHTRRPTATPTDTATPTPTWYIPFGATPSG